MIKHDPYLTNKIETIGRERTIIALQQYGALSFRSYERAMRYKRYDHLLAAAHYQQNATWAYKNARILMGIETD